MSNDDKVLANPRISALDFDDAFSDGDDSGDEYQFSPDVVREDMARNHPNEEPVEEETPKVKPPPIPPPFVIDAWQSPGSRSSSPPQSPDDELDSNFVQISLSTAGLDDSEDYDDQQEVEEIPLDSYPRVLIDASKPPEHRVTLSSESNGFNSIPALSSELSTSTSSPRSSTSDRSRSPQSVISSQSLPSTPKAHLTEHSAANGASTSALPAPNSAPIPASSSLPNSSPGLTEPPPKTRRQTRSVGPSALERFRSKTRPSFLPPKSRQEDDKHMADWEVMMKQSRIIAENRRKALQERRLAREKKIEDSLSVWEKEILPDWRVVHKNPALRKLWWKGIPSKLRASMWERAVGNPLALSKDTYRTCLARAKRAITSGNFPAATMTLIEEDIAGTLPALHIFHHETGPLYSDLKDMLCAWLVARTDEGLGYKHGAAKLAAMLLINMPVQPAFVVMRNLLERHCLRSFYGSEGAKHDVEGYYRIFDTILADGMPKIYFNFKQHQISPASYLPEWLIPLFINHLPFEACARVWDVILLEGDSFLYRAALGMLAVLEPRLFFPDRKELLELLRGDNKAAIDVARREGRPLDGGKYEIYGVDEETLWERIDSMDDWWRESTWNRLIHRELPDL
ncbi:rab-GTPase-TBC domain-containing protein [Mycena floridula]|nr:rab-GTPase-TBC domain-containing protein [Mycena floridula]